MPKTSSLIPDFGVEFLMREMRLRFANDSRAKIALCIEDDGKWSASLYYNKEVWGTTSLNDPKTALCHLIEIATRQHLLFAEHQGLNELNKRVAMHQIAAKELARERP